MATNGNELYALLAPVLRACTEGEDDKPPSEEERLTAAQPLTDWVLSELAQDGQTITLTSKIVLVNLENATRELIDWAEADPSKSVATGYTQIKFIHHLLCRPPTLIKLLARTFEVDLGVIADWLSDKPSSKEAHQVANRVLKHLVDLCGDPEEPEKPVPGPPLRSFDDLKFLGSLRHAFDVLYPGGVPKIAQAQYIPGVLRALDSRFGKGHGGEALVIAPTNGGKNGIILAAALAAIAWDEGPVIVLQPYRAQITESRRSWNAAVAGRLVRRRKKDMTRGVTIAGSSALISDADFDIKRGRIDVTAIIPEKLAVLSRDLQLASFCGYLIADEIALLLSSERGPKLEIMLTLAKEAGIPLLATGAGLPIEPAERVGKWLGNLPEDADPAAEGILLFDAELKRDPPLEYWVWRRDGERRHWKPGMNVADPMEDHVRELPLDREEAVSELVLREIQEDPGRQVLVFLEDRRGVLELADSIASHLKSQNADFAESLAAQAQDAKDPPLRDIWLGGALPFGIDIPGLLEQRVGVHTRDIPSNNLEGIEDAFRHGRLRVLCATTTVEAGINMPVDTVVQVGLLDHNQRRLSQRSLEQRLGRSGRTLSGRESPGRGIVYIHDETQSIERVIPQRILKQDHSADSHLSEDFRALLLLTYIGSTSDKTTTDLQRLLGRSYWAYGRTDHEVKKATTDALAKLQTYQLVAKLQPQSSSEDQSPDAWVATPLGQALASALLTPRDAQSIGEIVDIAENAPPGDVWLAETLLAASTVPSLVTANRRPTDTDVVARPPLDRKKVFCNWTRLDNAADHHTFGFPGTRFPRMVAGAGLDEVLSRILNGHPKKYDDRLVIRTYVSWLWVKGFPIDIKQFVRELSDHVVKQDLAYYLSHVIRAAAWLAEYDSKYLTSLRLRELAEQVKLGVVSEALEFFDTCHEHVRRDLVCGSHTYDYAQLLNDLEPRVAEDLSRRLDIRRRQKHTQEGRRARLVGAIETEAEAALFDRIQTSEDLKHLFARVWCGDTKSLHCIDDKQLKLGSYTVRPPVVSWTLDLTTLPLPSGVPLVAGLSM